ncbi:MAG: hypothetical protein CVT49_05830 [candidate division Zixibacteria bacterium HGW-Zixibacteria-1]|nr:MAG: hypothetical protein CVT49_05830 [candidate division Zixibacteria bacterium HGW-Zixibacteria-1]
MADNIRKKAVILNSRQGLRPVGNDPWIVNSQLALRHAISRNCTILTSTGMKTWELVLFLASHFKAHQEIFLPVNDNCPLEDTKEELMSQFCIDPELCDWTLVEHDHPDRNILPQLRDKSIIGEADILYPVSIRGGGNLEKMIAEARENGKEIVADFMVEYQDTEHRCRISVDPSKIDNRIDSHFQDYIIHWTKASNTVWPDESLYDHYHALFNSASVYPRSGLSTLLRILAGCKLLPSSRHYRKEYPAVAFSSLLPSEAVALMQWRARYREMTIEPYGIAIHKDYADTLGIRKVFYGNPEMFGYLEDKDKAYFQSIGTKGFWMPEKEYRHIGAIDLSFVPADRMAVIVGKPDEIEKVREIYDGKIFSLYRQT